eukprot:scaffold76693_cov73-Phaeocystis_antarctica.AAC.3
MFIKKFEHASGSESAFNFLYVAVVVVGLVVVAVVIAVSVQSFRGWGRSGPLPRQCGAVCFRRMDSVSDVKRNRHVQTTLTTFVRIGCSRGEWCSRGKWCSRSRWCYRAIAARSGWTVYVDTSRRAR